MTLGRASTAATLLDELLQKGAGLQGMGDRLRVFMPRGAMTAHLKARIAANKPGLLREMQRRVSSDTCGTENETVADPELQPRLNFLTVEEYEFFHQRFRTRGAAGESEAGLGWRALVDVRMRFGHWECPAMWTTSVSFIRPGSATAA